MKPGATVSFVIPCLNEQKTLRKAIGLAKNAITQLGPTVRCEIVIADNGSTDNSKLIAEEEGARLVAVPDRGYGAALAGGISAADGEYIVMGDADGTYNFVESVEFLEVLDRENVDLVMGSRLKGRIEKGAMPWLHRYIGTPVLTFLIRNLFKIRISDCNCGMRAFRKDAYAKMCINSTGMEFASEMLIKAGILGLKVREIPCSLAVDTRDKPPHLKTWRDGWRHLRFILVFAPEILFSIPGNILLAVGLAITLLLSIGSYQFSGVTLDYHIMLLGSVMMLVGAQLQWLARVEKHFVDWAGYFKEQKVLAFNLERSLGGSLLLALVGIALGVTSIVVWTSGGFDAGKYGVRFLIGSVDALVISVIAAANAFVVATMGIKVKRNVGSGGLDR